MKKVLLIVSLLMLSLLVASCTTQVQTQPSTSTTVVETAKDAASSATQPTGNNVYTVVLSGNTFQPADVEIKVGDTVEWVNKKTNDDTQEPNDENQDANDHTVTFNTLGVDEFLPAGGSFTHTFAEAGEYTYFCSIHSGMQGKVIVN
ncbi:cupredoxin domain-containing protein [Candidatus Woesearchaeota archaeon]|nr:cupredoxin domain-containing protein [Candidatus Woesearchaeota archaeon]